MTLTTLTTAITSTVYTYKVIDRHNGKQVGKDYACRIKASRRVDKLDNAYGAYRYTVVTYVNGIKLF